MKKYILIFFLLFLVSCWSNQSQEIESAKQELLQENQNISTENNTNDESEVIWENAWENGFLSQEILESLPVEIQSEIQTYENIEDAFVFEEKDISELTCENLTSFLGEHYSWFYWNSCRDLKEWSIIYFQVLSLEDKNYKYERHYVNFEKWVYAKVLLETWWPITSDDLSDMNQILRDKTFENISEYDTYFLWL